MNREMVDKLARALLYEGYILYPYRPSVKNRQRWTFGGLHPRAWSEAHGGSDAWKMQTQCLVSTADDAAVHVAVRFLHLMNRTVGELPTPVTELPTHGDPEVRQVESLTVGDRTYQPWQEATEREVDFGEFNLKQLVANPECKPFSFPHHRAVEPLREADGEIVGLLIREQEPIEGTVEISAERTSEALFRVTIRILNLTNLSDAKGRTRDDALLRSLISTHTVLGVRGGEFVSLIDPSEEFRDAAAACRNIGTWPILIGQEPQRDTMLSSPITLYDYPELAQESPGDLFDSTEIDEILTLRILTLTDEEKRAAGVDDRSRDLIARTEALARDQLMGLHGTMRGLRPVNITVTEEQPHG